MKGSILKGMLLLILLGVTSAAMPASPAHSSPWMDTSLCSMTDSLMVCQLKKGICSPINTIFSPPGGPVKAIVTCAHNAGTVLGPQFFMGAGLSFLSGYPESLADRVSSDPATVTAIRRCALNATGLLNPDLLTLNRTAVSNSISSAFITPELGAAVATAVTTCPEPIDYKVTDFMTCLKVACMKSVSVMPFMSRATSALTGAGKPVPAVAASATKKSGPSNKFGSSSGSSPYSARSFAYPYAGGAFPYAGAGGASTGGAAAGFAGGAAPSASGLSAYMAGAFPYARAGAFPFAGAGSNASGAGGFP